MFVFNNSLFVLFDKISKLIFLQLTDTSKKIQALFYAYLALHLFSYNIQPTILNIFFLFFFQEYFSSWKLQFFLEFEINLIQNKIEEFKIILIEVS